MFAELLAKQLMLRGQYDITDHELHKLVFAIAEKTDLDDGTLAPPPPTTPPPPMAELRRDSYGGYAAVARYSCRIIDPPKCFIDASFNFQQVKLEAVLLFEFLRVFHLLVQ